MNKYDEILQIINDYELNGEQVLNLITDNLGLQICNDSMLETFQEVEE